MWYLLCYEFAILTERVCQRGGGKDRFRLAQNVGECRRLGGRHLLNVRLHLSHEVLNFLRYPVRCGGWHLKCKSERVCVCVNLRLQK